MRVALAQLNSTVGDIDSNIKKILSASEKASKDGVSLLVTPELSLTGYPPEDLLLSIDFLKIVENKLMELGKNIGEKSPDMTVVIGHPSFNETDSLVYNSASIFKGGVCLGTYSKLELPNYAVFDERRYFSSNGSPLVFECDGVTFGINICEDVWFPRAPSLSRAAGAQALIVLNASPFHVGKCEERINIVRKNVTKQNLTTFFCNLVGGQDELVFDGNSFVLDNKGNLVSKALGFKEDIVVVDFDVNEPFLNVEQHSLEMDHDAQVFNALVLGTRDYVKKNKFKDVILGLSGGIDSAVTLGIAVEALGRDAVKAVFMKSQFTTQASVKDAKECAKNFGVSFFEEEIDEYMHLFEKRLGLSNGLDLTELSLENLQSRIRGVILMAISNSEKRLLLTTGNKSELAVGYCTLYGDMCGAFSVLKDVFKTQVYKLATVVNERCDNNLIPLNIMSKAPSAELRYDQRDEDSLPPYDVLDDVLARVIEKGQSLRQVVEAGHSKNIVVSIIGLLRQSEFKRRQSALGVRVSEHAFGRDWRYPVSNRFIC